MVHLILSMQERNVDEKCAKTPHSCFPNMFSEPHFIPVLLLHIIFSKLHVRTLYPHV